MTDLEQKVNQLRQIAQVQHQELVNLQQQSLFIGFTVEYIVSELEKQKVVIDFAGFDAFATERFEAVRAEAMKAKEESTKQLETRSGLKLDE